MKQVNTVCEKCKKKGSHIIHKEFYSDIEKYIAKEVLNEVIKSPQWMHFEDGEHMKSIDVEDIKQLAKDKYNIEL